VFGGTSNNRKAAKNSKTLSLLLALVGNNDMDVISSVSFGVLDYLESPSLISDYQNKNIQKSHYLDIALTIKNILQLTLKINFNVKVIDTFASYLPVKDTSNVYYAQKTQICLNSF